MSDLKFQHPKESALMVNTQIRQWLKRILAHRSSPARRRSRRVWDPIGPAAEVLEGRQLLTVGVPYLAFVQQPGNAIAGHALSSFTVDVMIQFRNALHPTLDTSFNGGYMLTANGPGVIVAPSNSTVLPPNQPVGFFVGIINGVGKYLARFDNAALDVTGTYTLTAASPPGTGFPVIAGSAVSAKFTVTPDTASDHLVFLNLQNTVLAGAPFSVTVEVEDQFGNIDKSISNTPAYLITTGGNVYTSNFVAGQATFTVVTLPAAPPSLDPFSQDMLFADVFAGPYGFIFGSDTVTVVSPNSGG
jgi:hypothetical protein